MALLTARALSSTLAAAAIVGSIHDTGSALPSALTSASRTHGSPCNFRHLPISPLICFSLVPAFASGADAYETTLNDTPAATIEGVIAKLRVAFSRIHPNAWSDQEIKYLTSSDFREGLRLDGMFDRMAWSAIEDLARVGGFSLTDHGA
ncbi:hypothetical protein FHT00_003076 [Sphingomonas insulae]|uniref:hypothetical protein n=1 Tax=Sphingomonas insulae TaxID=424800 RepID=UPI0013D47500|nr:hypothetical protein [Sphingomonas insulae]NIJ31097.1 hypothetical protein [Sphingomonas insulae]